MTKKISKKKRYCAENERINIVFTRIEIKRSQMIFDFTFNEKKKKTTRLRINKR